MRKLNLETKCKEHELIKAYLEENASEHLASKINNGVIVEQDGKQLINKKTLDDFMKFACKEAQNLATKGANGACVEDNVVYGWAIHFFEENELIGTLYNPDGTKYEKPKPKYNKTTTTTTPVAPPKPKHEQTSLFDLSSFANKKEDEEEKEEEIEETEIEDTKSEEEIEDVDEEETTVEKDDVPTKQKGSTIYQIYQDVKDSYLTSVIAMRLGDFYEIFGQDAVDIAKELDLTLTGRDCGLEQRIPMVGFPYHCADKYFEQIIENHSLIVVDSNGTFIDSLPQNIDESNIIIEQEDPLKEFAFEKPKPKDVLQEENALMKAYDSTSLMILLELFGDNATIG